MRTEQERRAREIGRHLLRYPRTDRATRLPGEPNYRIRCGCGCGASLMRFDRWGRARAFVRPHNRKLSPTRTKVMAALLDGPKGVSDLVRLDIGTRKAMQTAIHVLLTTGRIRRIGRGKYERA